MTRKIYRTAQGRMVDLGALQLQNEHVRAVGNMKVNARGDRVDSNNRAIESRNQQVGRQYRRQVTNTSDMPVSATAPAAEIPPAPEDFQDDFVKAAPVPRPAAAPAPARANPAVATAADVTPGQGLAAAIARARQVQQEPLKTPRQVAQLTPGVRKI